MKTNTEIVHAELGDDARRCLWQIYPGELPQNAPAMVLELWEDSSGKLHLFQFLLRSSDPGGDWYNRIRGFIRFEAQ